MKTFFLLLAMLILSINLHANPPDSCLKMIMNNDIHWDPDKGSYVGNSNPDSVMIDTCVGSATFNKRFATRYFILNFKENNFPFDNQLEPNSIKGVSDISTSQPELKAQFQQLEVQFGIIFFQGQEYKEVESDFWLNPGCRLLFDKYQNLDEIISVFSDIIDSLRNIIYYSRYGSPTSAINSLNKTNTANIYPNPVNNILEINLTENETPKFISIYNIYSQIVYSSEFKDQIDASFLPSGMYFLKLGNHTYKFIKE